MPLSPDEDWEYWDKKAIELWRNQTANVNAAAEKWIALASSLVGVFSVVAFAGGLTTLDRLSSPWHNVALVGTTVAVFCAIASIIYLGLAAGGLRTRAIDRPLDGLEVKTLSTAQARASFSYLKVGRALSLITVCLVVAGSLLILWVGSAEEDLAPANYIAVFDDSMSCGDLSLTAEGRLAVGGRDLGAGLRDLFPVATCPGNGH